MDGFVNLLKPPGMTSHDAVDFARRQLRLRRIGHGGTLDPGAAGVLPLCIGRATRLADVVLHMPKTYRAEMTLGVTTDTHDQFGTTVRVESDFQVSPAALGEGLSAFIGPYDQIPPMTSARRHKGKRLYELAREGRVVAREVRRVVIYDIRLVAIIPDEPFGLGFGTRVLFDVDCSSGTYIRTLCHDIGERLGCGAHMSFLIRTRVGPFSVEDALTCEQFAALVAERRAEEAILAPEAGVSHLPAVELSPGDARRFTHGQPVPWEAGAGGYGAAGQPEGWPAPEGAPAAGSLADVVRVHGSDGRLLGLGRLEEGTHRARVHPYRVLRLPEGPGDGGGSENRERNW